MCLTLALGVRVEFRDVGRSIDLPKGDIVQKNFFGKKELFCLLENGRLKLKVVSEVLRLSEKSNDLEEVLC